MAFDFQQTDANSSNSPLCSGNAAAVGTTNCVMAIGGTPGISPRSAFIPITAGSPLYGFTIMSATNEPGVGLWDTGDWTVRIRHTLGDPDVTLEEVHICRLDAAGVSLGTVASQTGLGTVVDVDTEVINFNGVGAVVAEITNRIGVVFSYENVGGSAETITVAPDQIVNTPILASRNLNGTSA